MLLQRLREDGDLWPFVFRQCPCVMCIVNCESIGDLTGGDEQVACNNVWFIPGFSGGGDVSGVSEEGKRLLSLIMSSCCRPPSRLAPPPLVVKEGLLPPPSSALVASLDLSEKMQYSCDINGNRSTVSKTKQHYY